MATLEAHQGCAGRLAKTNHAAPWTAELVDILREAHQGGAGGLATLDEGVGCAAARAHGAGHLAAHFDHRAAASTLEPSTWHGFNVSEEASC